MIKNRYRRMSWPVNTSSFGHFKYLQILILEKNSRIVNNAESGGLLIRDLYSQGLIISEIARQTGFDRKTIRKYLKMNTFPEPQKRPGRKSELDTFKPYILEKLKEGPYTAARLYREIKEMGFDRGLPAPLQNS